MGPPAKRLKGQKALPWVRIPLSPPVWHQHAPSWLSGLERLPAEEEVTGSNPVEGAFFILGRPYLNWIEERSTKPFAGSSNLSGRVRLNPADYLRWLDSSVPGGWHDVD